MFSVTVALAILGGLVVFHIVCGIVVSLIDARTADRYDTSGLRR
jgi:flagellar biosynthesis protein FliQ